MMEGNKITALKLSIVPEKMQGMFLTLPSVLRGFGRDGVTLEDGHVKAQWRVMVGCLWRSPPGLAVLRAPVFF